MRFDTQDSYFIDSGEVVYEFDIRNANHKTELEHPDFEDINIDSMITNESYKLWSKEGWIIRKIGTFTYQLRKKLKDFSAQFDPRRKYIMHKSFWLQPMSEIDLASRQIETSDLLENSGNTVFELAGNKKASTVILSGSFNDWDEQMISMEKVKDGWAYTLDLPPGLYEYKFIVDGKWIADPNNALKIRNEYHSFNSMVHVGPLSQFVLKNANKAKKVYLSGSFNNWDTKSMPMQRQGDVWTIRIPLAPGKHFYKFIVDGTWILDPDNPLHQEDKRGNINSVKIHE